MKTRNTFRFLMLTEGKGEQGDLGVAWGWPRQKLWGKVISLMRQFEKNILFIKRKGYVSWKFIFAGVIVWRLVFLGCRLPRKSFTSNYWRKALTEEREISLKRRWQLIKIKKDFFHERISNNSRDFEWRCLLKFRQDGDWYLIELFFQLLRLLLE